MPPSKTLENPPGEDEFSAAYDKIFGGGAAEEPEPAGEETGDEPTPPESAEPDEAGEEQAAARTQAGKAKPEQEAEEGEFVTIRGRKVPVSEVEEWEMGSMRQAEFTRGTQAIAEERRFWQSQLKDLTEQNRQILALYGRNPDGTSKDATAQEETEPLPPGVDKALQNLQKNITQVQQRIEQRDQQETEQREVDYIKSNFESTLTTLFTKFKIDASEHALYRNAILGMNPLAADESGRVNADTIRRETFRCFSELNRQRQQHQRRIRQDTVQDLRQHAKPPAKKVAGKAQEATPQKPQARKSREPWSTDEAVQDVF